MFFVCPILSNLVIIKKWKELKKKHPYIFFGYPFGFMAGCLIFFQQVWKPWLYIRTRFFWLCEGGTTHITVGGGGSLFLIYNNFTLLVGGGNGQDFLSGRLFTFMNKNVRFQFKNIIRSVLCSSSYGFTRKRNWQSGLYGFGDQNTPKDNFLTNFQLTLSFSHFFEKIKNKKNPRKYVTYVWFVFWFHSEEKNWKKKSPALVYIVKISSQSLNSYPPK
jgi:hypothetical protein